MKSYAAYQTISDLQRTYTDESYRYLDANYETERAYQVLLREAGEKNILLGPARTHISRDEALRHTRIMVTAFGVEDVAPSDVDYVLSSLTQRPYPDIIRVWKQPESMMEVRLL